MYLEKNIERMAGTLFDTNSQSLQHMLTHSNWDHEAVLAQVASEADRLLGGSPKSCLIIDDSGFPKKGRKSAGVARQWCGRLGKVDNCQVGVFSALAKGRFATLIDAALYLPESWTKSKKRCDEADIPQSRRAFKTKVEMALEMVAENRRRGVRFSWIGVDGGFGKDPAFLRGLVTMGELFMADVHSTQRVYLEDPKPAQATNRRGRRQRLQTTVTPIDVKQWAAKQPNSVWYRLRLRDTTKGSLIADFLHYRVWLWDGKEAHGHCWHLIVRRDPSDPGNLKYSLCNAPSDIPLKQLANMQAQRFWVERAIQDAKSEAGLDNYQARKWLAWHHHMALSLMAMLFFLQERFLQEEIHPLLSVSDVREMLIAFLPRKQLRPHEVVIEIEKRHRKRAQQIQSNLQNQMVPDGSSYILEM